MDEAESLVRSLLGISDDYAVLFLTGGASSQFYMTAMNLLKDSDTAAYLDTGTWSTKSIKEAIRFAEIDVVATSKDQKYAYVPKGFDIPDRHRYLHITTNNTIYGTQIHNIPSSPIPLVIDMSSDIFSKPIEINNVDAIYAGAQKNLGPAGTTLVIVRKDALGKTDRDLPTMLDYRTHIEKGSMFNTPPVFPIYVCLLTLRWIIKNGGLIAMEEKNKKKAHLLYNTIDRHDMYIGHAAVEDRSLMNVTFNLADPELDASFLNICEDHGCVGVKGHRSVGGFRASIYNAMPYESVKVLADIMDDFARSHG